MLAYGLNPAVGTAYLDVSAFNGEYYINIGAVSLGGSYVSLTCTEIFSE